VVVGYNGAILTSSDGMKWAKRDSKVDNRLQEVAFGEDRFVAAGGSGCILTSVQSFSSNLLMEATVRTPPEVDWLEPCRAKRSSKASKDLLAAIR